MGITTISGEHGMEGLEEGLWEESPKNEEVEHPYGDFSEHAVGTLAQIAVDEEEKIPHPVRKAAFKEIERRAEEWGVSGGDLKALEEWSKTDFEKPYDVWCREAIADDLSLEHRYDPDLLAFLDGAEDPENAEQMDAQRRLKRAKKAAAGRRPERTHNRSHDSRLEDMRWDAEERAYWEKRDERTAEKEAIEDIFNGETKTEALLLEIMERAIGKESLEAAIRSIEQEELRNLKLERQSNTGTWFPEGTDPKETEEARKRALQKLREMSLEELVGKYGPFWDYPTDGLGRTPAQGGYRGMGHPQPNEKYDPSTIRPGQRARLIS